MSRVDTISLGYRNLQMSDAGFFAIFCPMQYPLCQVC